MKEFANIDFLDEMADNLAQSIGATDNSILIPNLNNLEGEDKELAKLLIPFFNGSEEKDASELTAILLYLGQKETFEDIGPLMTKVAIVEMWHYSLLKEAIKKLGGEITVTFSNKSAQKLGKDALEALKIAQKSEEQTIKNCNALIKILDQKEKENILSNVTIIKQLITKIKKDEEVHLDLFKNQMASLLKEKDLIVNI